MNVNWLKQAGFFFLVFSLLLSPFNATPAYALDTPVLISPADDVTTTVADTPPLGIPEFKWAAVTGAKTYRLQVSSDIAFTSSIVNITTTNTSYTPSAASPFSDGVWYWRVRADSPSPVGEYSTIRRFTKQWASPSNSPLLNSPADYATLDFYDQPGFSWEPVIGAAEYKLQVYSSSGGWGTTVYNAKTLSTTHQPALKLTNGTYFWRVVPLDVSGREGTPSAERTFTAGYNLVPALLTPANGSNPTFTPTFRWTAVRGAQNYVLQYTTDSSFSTGITSVTTRNTAYTPVATLPNDVNYYWRVRAYSGNSISEWSSPYNFLKKWYIKPVLLTPTNNYQHTRFPLYSWTPVPGAERYFVEISLSAGFNPIYDSDYTANTFYSPKKYDGADQTYYWRVTPYDGNNNKGQVSNTASYRSYAASLAPHQVYPLFYYLPDNYAGFSGVTTNPHEDRTAPLPIFVWHRVYNSPMFANPGKVSAQAYRLQVSTDPTFSTVDWTVDTENLTATPTASNPFTPAANTDYYWRVLPLGISAGEGTAQWSQVWRTRFDPSRGLSPVGSVPELIRPTTGFEFAEMTPLLEWFPVNGAASYDVQISRDAGFTDIADSATVAYPAYAPTQSLAQRNLGDQDFGVYYWREDRY